MTKYSLYLIKRPFSLFCTWINILPRFRLRCEWFIILHKLYNLSIKVQVYRPTTWVFLISYGRVDRDHLLSCLKKKISIKHTNNPKKGFMMWNKELRYEFIFIFYCGCLAAQISQLKWAKPRLHFWWTVSRPFWMVI